MTNPDGVPSLADPDVAFDEVDPVDSDGADVTDSSSIPLWGIFTPDGEPALTGDSTLAFEVDQDSSVTNYPIEDGGFESYNKVQVPFRVKFTFTKGGTTSDRANFLKKLDDLQASLDQFVGLTPEIAYPNLTIDHYDLRRSSKAGVTLLTVDVWCQEIRTAASIQAASGSPGVTQITTSQDPESDDAVNSGPVQAAAPSQQSLTPAAAQGPPGSIDAALTAPATLTAPLISLTRALGNVVPSVLGSAVRAAVTYANAGGPASGIVSGVRTGIIGQVTAYILRGPFGSPASPVVPVNEVTNILPPGFTVVQ